MRLKSVTSKCLLFVTLQLEIRGEWLTLEFPFLTCSLAKKTITLENETWQRARQRLEVYNYGKI